MLSVVKPISKREFSDMVYRYHYSKVMPKLTKIYLGGFDGDELVAVMSLGWGVRPLHTIRKLFPSLGTKDYLEIGKMCLPDSQPKNSESRFISLCLKYLKKEVPGLKLVFTWADGMLGKPGYIYQASNFYYGGFAETDSYFSGKGEKVHPRTTGAIGGRPSIEKQKEIGFSHYKGRQFRYVYFLCSKKEEKSLLDESDFTWSKSNNPKDCDLKWRKRGEDGWADSPPPNYDPYQASFRNAEVLSVSREQQALSL